VAGAFKLLVLIHDGDTKSYLARHPAFDRTVMLHMLPKPGSAERDALTGYLTRLPPAAEKLLLEWGEENGAGFLVTDKIVDFRNLRDWLEKVALPPAAPVAPEPAPPVAAAPHPPPAAPDSPVPATPAPAAPPARVPGEFTRLFQAVPDATPEPPSQPVAPPAARPGEFTRLFSVSQPTAPPVPGEVGKPAPTSTQTRQPGAFTKAFQALSESSEPGVPPPTASAESTGFFEAPLPPAPEEQDFGRPAARPPEASNRPAFQQAGEFTRMFGHADPPGKPVESPRPPAPAEPGKPPASDSYTSMFSAKPEPAPAPAPALPVAAPAPPPPKSAASSNLPIIIILVALLLAALGLIAYFALKR